MGNEEGLPQLTTFRDITGHDIGKGNPRKPSRFPELRRRSCEFKENKMVGVHRTKYGRHNNRGSQRSAKGPPPQEFNRVDQCMHVRKLPKAEERTNH